MTHEQDSMHDAQGISVHTGFPNPAIDTRLHSLDLNQLLISHSASTYFFRIKGNEWESSGIFHGDIAIIDRALDAFKNDTVLWWDNGHEEFSISTLGTVPSGATVWGVITSIIHQLRKVGRT